MPFCSHERLCFISTALDQGDVMAKLVLVPVLVACKYEYRAV